MNVTALQENITVDQLVATVRRLAADKPDFIYEKEGGQCLYTHKLSGTETPGCIMGHAFAELGYPLDFDDSFNEGCGIGEFGFDGSKAQSDDYYDGWSWTDQLRWLEDVQSNQDQGSTWADAVETADRSYPAVAA